VFKSESDVSKFLDAVEKKYPSWMAKLDFPKQTVVVLKVK